MASVNDKFSVRMASKIHRLKKLLKPVMKLLHGTKKPRPAPVAHPCQESYADQNSANEAMESRVREDIIRSCGVEGGEVRLFIEGRVTVIRGQLARVPIPVHFSYTPGGELLWAPLPDSDVCLGRSYNHHTQGQTAEEQVPV